MLLPLSPPSTMPPQNSFSSKPKKPSSNPNPNPNHSSSSSSSSHLLLCKHHHHSPSATTLDLLILLLVLFSSLFLISSLLSHLFHSLSLLLSPPPLLPLPLLLSFLLFSAISIAAVEFFCPTSRRCSNPRCKGLKKSLEFDIQLQTEESLRSPSSREIDLLPWKGGSDSNPDYDCLRSELRRMAPPNGRAVLLFRSRCGCAIAKLEAWGPKRSRRHKKGVGTLAIDGGDRSDR
ncbi:uncharacterized protein At5g19025-like [Magnolia sinica]|uniref:uncharacterized protein At5g19025-like n=1 Tax=Magnolia sinica TaxID=86752 RepID=UPI002659BAE9|nr:uncharacterized protein At5g19025-like [Magnolia sinica]